MESNDVLLFEKQGGVATLTLNCPTAAPRKDGIALDRDRRFRAG